MMKLLSLLFALVVGFSEGCNRYYTGSDSGKILSRINRRTGSTKDIGRWQTGGSTGGDRIIDSLEWNFPQQTMYGLELDEGRPARSQRFVRVNRQKPRGASVNNVTQGLTDRFDLRGLAVDGNDVYYSHSLDSQGLYEVNPSTGAVSLLFTTGLSNVIDLAYRIDAQEIWAITPTQIWRINPTTEVITEFVQDYVTRTGNLFSSIVFNPVQHVPIILTQYNASTGHIPTVYRLILANGTEVFQGETTITSTVEGGTLQCKRIVFSPSPTAAPPTRSPVPTQQPTLAALATIELDPFAVAVTYTSGDTLNRTALQSNVESYLLSSQTDANVVAINLQEIASLPPVRRRLQATTTDTVNYNGTASYNGNAAEAAAAAANVTAAAASAVENTTALTAAVNSNGGVLGSGGSAVASGATASAMPSELPSAMPSLEPSSQPSSMPSLEPSSDPSSAPSTAPSINPSGAPSSAPSSAPSPATGATPSAGPSSMPSEMPSWKPSSQPSWTPSVAPSYQPSWTPSVAPSTAPSWTPSVAPSIDPSSMPSWTPSVDPSSDPSWSPSSDPSAEPSFAPSKSSEPSYFPSPPPSIAPSKPPTPVPQPSEAPSFAPSKSQEPSQFPSPAPSSPPSNAPSPAP